MTSSDPALLVLHAVRLLGFSPTPAVAARFGLDEALTEELLEDHRALGLVTWSAFADSAGWSLTERGRVEGEARLARELEATGRRDVVHRTYLDFLDLNAGVLQAVTDWQSRPVAGDPFAANDHQDLRWDTRVLRRLEDVGGALGPLAGSLAAVLDRLDGYSARYESALARARAGEREWVDGLGRDSCHTVWFQLHEDLAGDAGHPPRARATLTRVLAPHHHDGGRSPHGDRHPDERRHPRGAAPRPRPDRAAGRTAR